MGAGRHQSVAMLISSSGMNGEGSDSETPGWKGPSLSRRNGKRGRRRLSRSTTEASVPHAYTDDADEPVVVDGVAAVRRYFRMPGKGAAKNILLVRFDGAAEETRLLFVATAATMSLLGSDAFKMSETPDGNFYVCTATERDAALLDGQLYSGFGVQVAYHRVSRIEIEPRIAAMGDDAAFKLFDRDC